MKILIDINHPAHVHLFRNFASIMKEKGHIIKFTTRQKEITHVLLNNFNIEYSSFGDHYNSLTGKLWGIVKFDVKLYLVALKFKPDLLVSMGGIYASHVSKMISKPHVLWTDTENARLQHLLSIPFADSVINPVCFRKKFRTRQIYYKGYHELAYLHPNYFKPDNAVLNELGVEENEKFVIMRFVSWKANHDIGHNGISDENKIKAVNEFLKYSRVFITSEGSLPKEIDKYRIRIAPEKIHHALAFSSLLFGESATMASECAVLGIPSIYVNNSNLGYTDEQGSRYGMVFSFNENNEDQLKAIKKGIEILSDKNSGSHFKTLQKKLLSEKIDVTAFMVWLIENYPKSRDILDKYPDYDCRFIKS